MYRVKISALSSIKTRELDPVRKGRVEAERAGGKKMVPIVVTINKQGKPILSDGHHRLSVARARGDKTISVKFTVLKGKDSWAAREEKRRGKT